MLLDPRLSIVFICGFALFFWAAYRIVSIRDQGSGHDHGGGATGALEHLGLKVDANASPVVTPSLIILPSASPTPEPPKPPPPPTFEETVRQLFAPIKHKDLVSEFIDPEGTVYRANNQIWTEPLGKDLLIVDVDTRYPEIMFDNDKRVDWEHSDNLVTQAVSNHYLYATIHNYSYHYYRPQPVPSHHTTWPKVHSIANLLPHYKFVVFFDADASIRHLRLPFEWLLNRWNVTHNTSFTMARDPLDPDCNLCDSNGVPMVNTGFVVAQNLPATFEMLDVWMACTGGETQYGVECGKWREKWAHEQSVFSDYLRWDFNPGGDNIRELECGEANGFPGHMWYDPVNCNGKFIRHHTFVKDRMKHTAADSVMQSLVDIMKLNFEKLKSEDPVVLSEEEDQKNAEPVLEQQEEEDQKNGEPVPEQQQEDPYAYLGDREGESVGKRERERVYHEPLRRN